MLHDSPCMNDPQAIGERLRRMRALVQASREKIATLGPAWGAHLAGEMVRRLGEAIDELERDIRIDGSAPPAPDPCDRPPARPPT
jgi:hypothetical protein